MLKSKSQSMQDPLALQARTYYSFPTPSNLFEKQHSENGGPNYFIQALCFSFSSLILTRASVMCLVKATCISLALGLLARFFKNIITSEILQPSISKSNL